MAHRKISYIHQNSTWFYRMKIEIAIYFHFSIFIGSFSRSIQFIFGSPYKFYIRHKQWYRDITHFAISKSFRWINSEITWLNSTVCQSWYWTKLQWWLIQLIANDDCFNYLRNVLVFCCFAFFTSFFLSQRMLHYNDFKPLSLELVFASIFQYRQK